MVPNYRHHFDSICAPVTVSGHVGNFTCADYFSLSLEGETAKSGVVGVFFCDYGFYEVDGDFALLIFLQDCPFSEFYYALGF